MTFTYTYDYEEDEEDAEEYGGPENDDWIHRAYEAQAEAKFNTLTKEQLILLAVSD
jgi:hypothetical protein